MQPAAVALRVCCPSVAFQGMTRLPPNSPRESLIRLPMARAPEPGTPEARLYSDFLRPRDWAEEVPTGLWL